MLAEERWTQILKIVEEEKTVTVADLTERLQSSESTIRRDLSQLDRMKKLVKVHGGATVNDTQYVMHDESMLEKYLMHAAEKEIIGAYAASLVKPGDFVFVDAGTTTEYLVDHITETEAVYVTNSLLHARKLLANGCRVLLPGGELKAKTEALIGAETVEALRKFHFTIGFFGANGVNKRDGFTTPESNEAMVKEIAMKHSAKRYALCDHSKFQRISPVTFAAFDDAEIITDQLTDDTYKNAANITEVGKA